MRKGPPISNECRRPVARGAALPLAVLCLVCLMGFAALVLDIGMLYLTRTQCQIAADAGAMAGVFELGSGEDYGEEAARQMAALYVSRNPVGNGWGEIDPGNDDDVVPGRTDYNEETGQYEFVPKGQAGGGPPYNALRVVVPRPVPYRFARAMGRTEQTVRGGALAVASLLPRDIVVVIDSSRSMLFDSHLSFEYQNRNRDVPINIHEVWEDMLDQGYEALGYLKPVWLNQVRGDLTVPKFAYNESGSGSHGHASITGNEVSKIYYNSYSPSNQYMPAFSGGSNGNKFTRWELMVMLGFATNWEDRNGNGRVDGWEGQTKVWQGGRWRTKDLSWSDNELGGVYATWPWSPDMQRTGQTEWYPSSSERSQAYDAARWIYLMTTGSNYKDVNGNYYQNDYVHYGMKTMIGWMFDNTYTYESFPHWGATRQQPIHGVKEAADLLVTFLDEMGGKDQLALYHYDKTSGYDPNAAGGGQYNYERVAFPETWEDYSPQTVSDNLAILQAGHIDGWTNIGSGIRAGKNHLLQKGRSHAHPRMLVLTDGNPNHSPYNTGGLGHSPEDYEDDGGPYGDWAEESPPPDEETPFDYDPFIMNRQENSVSKAQQYTRVMAYQARQKGIRIFTISLGTDSDRMLMEDRWSDEEQTQENAFVSTPGWLDDGVAYIGRGLHYHVEGFDIQDVEDDLRAVFQDFGTRRSGKLTQ